MRDKKTIIFDVDGTMIEHRRHLVNGDNKDWKNFRLATVDGVQWVCDIAKRYIAQGDEVISLVQETNQKERLLRNKLVNGLVSHKESF